MSPVDGADPASPVPASGLRLVLASANPDKAAEIAAILGAVPGLVLVPRPAEVADVEETGETLLDNARLKAWALVEATGTAAVADDTGLEVAALGGAPGVRSARFAGEHASYGQNVAKLLAELEAVGASSAADRRARFRTVALVAHPDGSEVWAEGAVNGVIASGALGDGGFGYDPLFVPDLADPGGGPDHRQGPGRRTFAQMTPAEKHAVSHRGRAFRALAERLAAGPPSP